jgi:hypothetical protein
MLSSIHSIFLTYHSWQVEYSLSSKALSLYCGEGTDLFLTHLLFLEPLALVGDRRQFVVLVICIGCTNVQWQSIFPGSKMICYMFGVFQQPLEVLVVGLSSTVNLSIFLSWRCLLVNPELDSSPLQVRSTAEWRPEHLHKAQEYPDSKQGCSLSASQHRADVLLSVACSRVKGTRRGK